MVTIALQLLYENAAQALAVAEQQVEDRLKQDGSDASEKGGGLKREVAALSR